MGKREKILLTAIVVLLVIVASLTTFHFVNREEASLEIPITGEGERMIPEGSPEWSDPDSFVDFPEENLILYEGEYMTQVEIDALGALREDFLDKEAIEAIFFAILEDGSRAYFMVESFPHYREYDTVEIRDMYSGISYVLSELTGQGHFLVVGDSDDDIIYIYRDGVLIHSFW